MKKVRQTQIYIGLNDSDTYTQKFETEKYVSILKRVCQGYHVAFSMSLINGGYFHEDGTYVEENTLMLTLLDVDEQTIEEIAKDLCAFFNQESVMVSSSEAEVHFVKDSIG
ncbi:MAG: DUF3574 domain-containing protein [Erysipelotrichaceae bacterium]|nr:DUF3574 domain-containing protein [Erysipelotrichaceae bacterium]